MSDRLSELLPWYVNGSLDAGERAWVEQELRAHPEAAGELDWYRSLRDSVQADLPAVSDEIGLERALARIRAERPSPAARIEPAAPSLAGRVSRWLSGWGMTPAFAAAAVVVLVQAGFIAHLLSQATPEREFRSLRPGAATGGAVLRINLKPEATEKDIRSLLREIGGRLVAGPGQLGDYYVEVPANREAAALARLQASPIVDAAAAIPGRD